MPRVMAFCRSIGSLRIIQNFSSAFRRLAEDGCIMTKYGIKKYPDGLCKKLASTKVSSAKSASVNQEMNKVTDADNTPASDTDGAKLEVKSSFTDGTKTKSTKSKTSTRKTVKASKSDKDKEKERSTQISELQVSSNKESASPIETETNLTGSTKCKSTNTKTGASKIAKTVKSKTNLKKEDKAKFGTSQPSEEEESKDGHDSKMSTTDNKVRAKTTKSERKTDTITEEDEPVPQKEMKSDRYDIQIPEWMEVVLECPPIANDKIDTEKFLQFKDFIEELEMKSLPSVTTIIKKTEPEEQAKILQKWMKKKTKELGGEEQFALYRQKLLTRGSSLHTYIEKYLAGERDFEVAPHIEGPWESIQHILPDVTDVKKTEKVIAHPDLFYKGQIDCLAAYRNDISVIEWKVSTKPKLTLSQTYDYPLQVAAYLGALNRSGVLKRLEVPNLTTGVIVVAYEDGEPATVHVMSERICNKYWGRWKERLFHYWALQYQKMLHVS